MDGGITVFSAGNSNTTGLLYPGCYSGAYSVAATNNQDQKAYYSTYDTWVDISAPGGETNVLQSRGILSTTFGNTYGFLQGTSMACPHVSGVAALVVSHARRNNFLISSDDLADILSQTADDHYQVNQTYTGMLGSGRINAYAALMEVVTLFDGVLNPRSLNAAMAGTDQINVTWQQNAYNNSVLLAWTVDGVFGTPLTGVAYSPGQQISGGGNVIYTGTGELYAHTPLDPDTGYHYKAFSYDALLNYSTGRVASARTDYTAFDLPQMENFDASTELADFWQIVDHQGNGQIWSIGRIQNVFSPGLAGTNGNYIFVNSYGYGAGNTQDTDLISPKLDLSSYSIVNLSFTHSFQQYFNASIATLSYSIDNGLTWYPIQVWNASTANPAYFNQDIASVLGYDAVRFKWNYRGNTSYNWCIDDICITGVIIDPLVPRNLRAISETGGINLNWDPPQSGTPDAYRLYRDGQLLDQPILSAGYLDNSVQYGQSYQYHVTAVFGTTESQPSNLVTASSVYQTAQVEIGSGTLLQGYPFNVQSGAGYTRSATVYLQQDIGQQNLTITRLEWYVHRTHSIQIPLKIYLKHYANNTIPPGNSWANLKAGATLVYEGNVQFDQSGWFGFNIPAFAYETGNLMVLTETNVEGYIPGAFYPQFRFSLSTSSIALGSYSTYNLAESSSLMVTPNRPNIRFHFISQPPALNPPQNLTALAGDMSASLSWVAPAAGSSAILQGYRIYRDNLPIVDLPTSALGYTDQNLINNILYRYQITAVYQEGESEASNLAEVIPREPILLLPPQEISIELLNNCLIISWRFDPEVSFYRVEASETISGGFEDITNDGEFLFENERILWQLNPRPDYPVYFFRVYANANILE